MLKILKGHWKAYLIEKPSLELCRHLVMLRDYNISGRINLMEIPVLLHMLHFWKVRNMNYKYILQCNYVRNVLTTLCFAWVDILPFYVWFKK